MPFGSCAGFVEGVEIPSEFLQIIPRGKNQQPRRFMARSLSSIEFKEGLLVGILFSGAGVFILLVSFGVIFADSGNPPAIIGILAGMCFLLPGLLSLYYAFRNRRRAPAQSVFEPVEWAVGLILLAALSAIGAYISLAGEEERFSGGLTGTAIEARIVFGIGTLICMFITIMYLVKGIGKWRAKKENEKDEKSGG